MKFFIVEPKELEVFQGFARFLKKLILVLNLFLCLSVRFENLTCYFQADFNEKIIMIIGSFIIFFAVS